MSWESEEERDASLRRVGAAEERARVRKAQAGALRNLRVLLMPECFDENVNGERMGACAPRHAEDCPKGMMLEALRWLRAATRRPR